MELLVRPPSLRARDLSNFIEIGLETFLLLRLLPDGSSRCPVPSGVFSTCSVSSGCAISGFARKFMEEIVLCLSKGLL